MTTPTPWSERRAAVIDAAARFGVALRLDGGLFTMTTADGEEYPNLLISNVEFYIRGLSDAMDQIARRVTGQPQTPN